MENKFIIIGSGLTLRRVANPTAEDILIISESDLLEIIPKHLQTEAALEKISRSIMKSIQVFCKIGLHHEAIKNLALEPDSDEIKAFLCTPIEKLFKQEISISLKRAGINYCYDLIFWDREGLSKIYRFGEPKLLQVEKVLKDGGITPELLRKIKSPIAAVKSYRPTQVFQTIYSLVF